MLNWLTSKLRKPASEDPAVQTLRDMISKNKPIRFYYTGGSRQGYRVIRPAEVKGMMPDLRIVGNDLAAETDLAPREYCLSRIQGEIQAL
jgi:predicted DNA-binding transcriptional regulator YafY